MVTTPTLRKVMAVVDEDAATKLAKLANTPILTAAVTSQIGMVGGGGGVGVAAATVAGVGALRVDKAGGRSCKLEGRSNQTSTW